MRLVSDENKSVYAIESLSSIVIQHLDAVLDSASLEFVTERDQESLRVIIRIALVYRYVYVIPPQDIRKLQ